MIQKYLNIISHYKKLRNEKPDTWLIWAKDQPVLEKAIHVAALAINHQNKRHPHQYRLKKVDMQTFVDKLALSEASLQNCKTFDELYTIVTSCKVPGVGKLAVYDTAHRIGAYLNIYPEFIYIHAGTKTGVQKLLGSVRTNKIQIENLPEPFCSAGLTAAELEDILCIYKSRL